MTEHDEQVAVVDYLHERYPNILFWSTPNGARLASGRGKQAGKLAAIRWFRLVAEGALPGVSDLIIFEPRGGYSAMFVEMKRDDGGDGGSENQLWFLRQIEERGGFGVIAEGYEDAKTWIDSYLSGRTIK
jgi:hypothetical protein